MIRATNEWFRIYKIPDGKPEVSYLSELFHTYKADCLERLCILRRGQVQEVRRRDHPRVPRGMEEARQRRRSFQGRGSQHQHVCFFPTHTSSVFRKLTCSANLTVKGSKGFVTTSDQAYTAIPADSRKPAAAIDPSSELFDTHRCKSELNISLQVLLHLLCFGLRTTVSCSAGVHCQIVAEKRIEECMHVDWSNFPSSCFFLPCFTDVLTPLLSYSPS